VFFSGCIQITLLHLWGSCLVLISTPGSRVDANHIFPVLNLTRGVHLARSFSVFYSFRVGYLVRTSPPEYNPSKEGSGNCLGTSYVASEGYSFGFSSGAGCIVTGVRAYGFCLSPSLGSFDTFIFLGPSRYTTLYDLPSRGRILNAIVLFPIVAIWDLGSGFPAPWVGLFKRDLSSLVCLCIDLSPGCRLARISGDWADYDAESEQESRN